MNLKKSFLYQQLEFRICMSLVASFVHAYLIIYSASRSERKIFEIAVEMRKPGLVSPPSPPISILTQTIPGPKSSWETLAHRK